MKLKIIASVLGLFISLAGVTVLDVMLVKLARIFMPNYLTALLVISGPIIGILWARASRQQLAAASSFATAAAGGAAPETLLKENWIVIERIGSVIRFTVRQKRMMRVVMFTFLAGGTVLLAGLAWSLAVGKGGHGSAMLALLLGAFAIAGLIATVVGLFPMLAAIAHPGTTYFAVAPNGVVVPDSSKEAVIPWINISGPYYAKRHHLETQRSSALFVGTAPAVFAASAAHNTGNVISDSVVTGINLVKLGSGGRVYVMNAGKERILARFLGDDEAQFLSEKLDAAFRAIRSAV